MRESFKLLFFASYFVSLYLISESYLVALLAAPLFAFIHRQFQPLGGTPGLRAAALLFSFFLPWLLFLFFSFTPLHWTPDKSISHLLQQSTLLGILCCLQALLYIASLRWYWKLPLWTRFQQVPPYTQDIIKVSVFLFLIPISLYLHMEHKAFQEKSLDEKAYGALRRIFEEQQKYKEQTGSYFYAPSSKDGNDWWLHNESLRLYLKISEVPQELHSHIPEIVHPYVEKKSFRALAILKNPHSRSLKLFLTDESGEIRQIKAQIPWREL